MNQGHIDKIIQYALAAAKDIHSDEWRFQELGPIHLLKYIYLADLAYARKHGDTYTGVNWRFFHFGPWAAEAFARLEPATQAIHSRKKNIASRFGDDFIRWSVPSPSDARQLCESLGEDLPAVITVSIKDSVRRFGNATPELLHHVYRTKPMLNAAPGDLLDFRPVQVEPEQEETRTQEPTHVRAKAKKIRQQMLKDARQRISEKLSQRVSERRQLRASQAAPRYDEVYCAGLDFLDEQAGPQLDVGDGVLEFSDDIWTSTARKGPEEV